MVFVEDGDGDGVERGRKARCWRGRGPGGGREGGKEGMVFVFWDDEVFEHV